MSDPLLNATAAPAWIAGDSTLVRSLAGPHLRRADTARDERAAERLGSFERHLRDLAAWWPASRPGRAAIEHAAASITAQAQALRTLDDGQLRAAFDAAQRLLRRAAHDDAGWAALLACVGEASRRTLGLWPHPVQFAGARVLLGGRLAEMRTGEGKTLVAAMAACAMAGSGARVHVVSTNDYLAERDSTEMAPLMRFFGLGCGFVIGGMEVPRRQSAYREPVCYVSGKELVFDYLKDRLAGHGQMPVGVSQVRELLGQAHLQVAQPLIPALHFAIVDEADSVLIDEARTPMILSREAPGLFAPVLLGWAITQAQRCLPGRHFNLLPGRDIEVLPAALAACEPLPPDAPPAWRSPAWQLLLLRQALTALHLYQRDQHYILVDGKVQIVDESTGRVMADRSWEQGLHQLIEAKEGLGLSLARETLARMTFQRFFRHYYLLCGLTGTAAEARHELWTVYRLRVVRIPPHRPDRRRHLGLHCQPDHHAKWQQVADVARAAARRGQPVLIGTRSVQASEEIAAVLERLGVAHGVLNARQDAEEARLVAQAGEAGRITVATNMAGRGTDIKLTEAARAAGGLQVILTEFHDSPRVDRQLFGRCARQGDPGSVCAIVSACDGLFDDLAPALRRLLRQPRLARSVVPLAIWLAQRQAEHRAWRARMHTLEQDRDLSRLIGYAGRPT